MDSTIFTGFKNCFKYGENSIKILLNCGLMGLLTCNLYVLSQYFMEIKINLLVIEVVKKDWL